jgi:hypothetical protein
MMVTPIILVMIDVIRSFRNVEGTVIWVREIFDKFSAERILAIARPILEYQAHLEFDIQYMLIKGFALNDHVLYSFYKILLMPFPRSILEDKPIAYSEKFCGIVNTDIANMSCGTGLVGEMFFNFGYTSFFASFVLGTSIGILIKLLNNLTLSNRDRFIPLSFALVPFFLDAYRSPLSDTLVTGLGILLIYKITIKRFILV